MTRRLINHHDGPDDSTHVVSVQYSNPGGEAHHVRLSPELVNRITHCLGVEELQQLAQTVANAVLKLDNRP